MSKLIVEVCRVGQITDHPNADKMKVAYIKGWQTCIKHNPETGVSQFKEGDLCIFFPPDAVLPKVIYDDRLGTGKYLHELPKNELGVRPEGKRVVACRLRGQPSYGVITNIDPAWGDDPNWVEGTDLVEHFGITKYEPPLESTEGDAERPNTKFYQYSGPENFGNYPDTFAEGEEVVFTEKIHGCLHKNSQILLYNGEEKNLNQIEIGERIRSFDGVNYVEDKVLKLICRECVENLDWYELLFDNGKKLICTGCHLICTSNGWVAAKDLTENDVIF